MNQSTSSSFSESSQNEENNIFVKKQWFIKSKLGRIEDSFELRPNDILGSGKYGCVIKGRRIDSNEIYAIKLISKDKIQNQKRLINEVNILRSLDHPGIIKLFETFEDTRNIYLVMEYLLCKGKELFECISDHKQFTEELAKKVFIQIAGAINYCHNNKICHRNIQPEKFIYVDDKNSQLKLIDFGYSTPFENRKNGKNTKISLQSKIGTPYYIAPEVIQGDYDQACDIWSMGVILYLMLSGAPPFDGKNQEEILRSVEKGVYSLDIPELNKVSKEAKDLISQMLTSPDKRINSQAIFSHPWILSNKQLVYTLNIDPLRQFSKTQRFKKIVLSYIASQLQEYEIIQLGNLFKQLDVDGNGVLSLEEIRSALNQKAEEFELRQLIHNIDTDSTGTIQYNEFIAACLDSSVYLQEEKLFMAFKAFDLDGSGKISKEEMKKILVLNDNSEKKKNEVYWDSLIQEVDINGDHEIDYTEFIQLMKKN